MNISGQRFSHASFMMVILLALGGNPTDILAEDRPAIPPGVRYKFIDDKLDSSVRTDLAARFAQGEEGVAGIFQGPCICAPGFWNGIPASDKASFKEAVPSDFSVPNTKTGKASKMKGAMFRNPDDLKIIAKLFSTDIGLKPTIRRLTTDEVALLWAVYPFDIEEPAFAVVNGQHIYVLCLIKDEKSSAYSVLWLDELTAYRSTPAKEAD